MCKVTVLMSTYNTPERYLRQAVDSVLAQSFSDFELLVVDDCSTSNDLSVLKSYADPRIRILENERNQGLAQSLHDALMEARGTYIARMDADDICLPDRLAVQVGYLEAHPEAIMVASCGRRFGTRHGIMGIASRKPERFLAEIFFNNRLLHPAVMLRAQAFRSLGLNYDPYFRRSQDYDLWERAVFAGPVHAQHRILLRYRMHAQQATHAAAAQQKQYGYPVRQRFLARLGLSMGEAEFLLHYALCVGKPGPSPEAMAAWAHTLIEANARTQVYESACFEQLVRHKLVWNCLMGLARHKYAPGAVVRSGALAPRNLGAFFTVCARNGGRWLWVSLTNLGR